MVKMLSAMEHLVELPVGTIPEVADCEEANVHIKGKDKPIKFYVAGLMKEDNSEK